MDKASIEVSRELFDLSGWCPSRNCSSDHKNTPPDYELGFLVRQLPKSINRANRKDSTSKIGLCVTKQNSMWEAKYWKSRHYKFAKIPEDAVALLAIELIKLGLIKDGTR